MVMSTHLRSEMPGKMIMLNNFASRSERTIPALDFASNSFRSFAMVFPTADSVISS